MHYISHDLIDTAPSSLLLSIFSASALMLLDDMVKLTLLDGPSKTLHANPVLHSTLLAAPDALLIQVYRYGMRCHLSSCPQKAGPVVAPR